MFMAQEPQIPSLHTLFMSMVSSLIVPFHVYRIAVCLWHKRGWNFTCAPRLAQTPTTLASKRWEQKSKTDL